MNQILNEHVLQFRQRRVSQCRGNKSVSYLPVTWIRLENGNFLLLSCDFRIIILATRPLIIHTNFHCPISFLVT